MKKERKGKLQAACFGVLAAAFLVKTSTTHWLGDALALTALVGFALLLLVRPDVPLPNEHGAEFVAKQRSTWRIIALYVIPFVALKFAVIAYFGRN